MTRICCCDSPQTDNVLSTSMNNTKERRLVFGRYQRSKTIPVNADPIDTVLICVWMVVPRYSDTFYPQKKRTYRGSVRTRGNQGIINDYMGSDVAGK